MRSLTSLLSILLLLSLASAAGYSACFPPPSALGFSADKTSYQGSFGNYTVNIDVYPPPSTISVDGPDASTKVLSEELRLLQEKKMLETPCNISTINMYSWSNYACAPDGTWADESQTGICAASKSAQTGELDTPPPAPEPEAKEAAAIGGGNENEPASQIESGRGQENAEPAATARAQDLGTGAQAPKTLAVEGNAPAASSPTDITLGQLLPLLGGFLAVVILSYLVLQQRQMQIEIDPQEERLLSNETRAGIMSELSQSDKIPTDLSMKLGKSKATVVEHLDALVGAGFVERVATPGRKFVFYRLTQKGKRALLRRAG